MLKLKINKNLLECGTDEAGRGCMAGPVYAAAVIFVNFALPISQLFVDGTNLLQNTLMTSDSGRVEISDIIKTEFTEQISSLLS